MRYNHEDSNADLLAKGWYEATITKAEDTVSKKGNEMMLLHVRVDRETGPTFIKDYIVSSVSFHLSRLKRLCEAIGISYEAGEVKADQLVGQEVSISVKIEDGTGDFGDKNAITAYGKTGEAAAKANDDDIPF